MKKTIKKLIIFSSLTFAFGFIFNEIVIGANGRGRGYGRQLGVSRLDGSGPNPNCPSKKENQNIDNDVQKERGATGRGLKRDGAGPNKDGQGPRGSNLGPKDDCPKK